MLRRTVFVLLFAAGQPALAETLKQQLPNGMTVIIKEDRRAPVAVSRLWYRVGSIDEQPGKTGLSHALEHMMFKGTPAVPAGEFSRRVAALGGRDNAYTSRSETVYTTDVAVGNLPEVLKMEADRMQNLNFSDRDFNNEMSVIREERRMRSEDSPAGKMWETLNLNAWQKANLRAPTIGYMNDLNQLQADDLRQWYRQWYAPNNAMLVIVGDVPAKATMQQVTQLFGGIAARPLPARNNVEDPQISRPHRADTTAITARPLFSLSWRVPHLQKLTDKTPYALDVLAEILSGNSSSRLDKNLLRGQEKAMRISVSYDFFNRESALFTISGMPSEGTETEELVRLIRQQITDIAQHGVSRAELQRIRSQSRAHEIYARDSMDSQAFLIGTLEANGFDYRDEAVIRRHWEKVNAADVQAAARLLVPERETLVVVNPRPGSHAAPADGSELNAPMQH